jgi:multiple sugar transport system ATP-binding protein
MRGGILQQVDTPQQLYDHPTNVFVAGFIGSPAMNFFKAKLDKADGGLIVDAGPFKVNVPPSKVDTYMPHAGKEVIFGIRPDDVHDPTFSPPVYASPVPAKVEVTELMGNEIFMHFKAGENNFIGRIDPRTSFKVGDSVECVFDMDSMHLFNVDGDQNTIV